MKAWVEGGMGRERYNNVNEGMGWVEGCQDTMSIVVPHSLSRKKDCQWWKFYEHVQRYKVHVCCR